MAIVSRIKSGGRPSGPKTRCSGEWTEAKFKSFIKNNLRSATRKWKPISDCKKQANRGYGQYECACCHEIVPPTVKVGRAKKTNIFVDHIKPIIDPEVGFTTWDECIDRMFCELDNLQLLCGACHDKKTLEERALAKETRAKNKNIELIEE